MYRSVIASACIIAATVAATALLYPALPETMITHWGADGAPNGFMDKAVAVSIVPVMAVAILALFAAIPRIDPLRKNIRGFMGYYEGLIVVTTAFMAYVDIASLLANIPGTQEAINMNVMVLPAMALLMYYIGTILGKTKQNWFIGIRTPWTLSSKESWEKTHALGGKLFKAVAVVALIATFTGVAGIMIFVAAIILVAVFLVVYSYVIFSAGKGR